MSYNTPQIQDPQATIDQQITESLKFVYKELKKQGHNNNMIMMFIMQELKQIQRDWK